MGAAAFGLPRRGDEGRLGNYENLVSCELPVVNAPGERNMWEPSHDGMSEADQAYEHRKEEPCLTGTYDCSLHCDWATECIHRQYRALAAGRVWYSSDGIATLIPRWNHRKHRLRAEERGMSSVEMDGMQQHLAGSTWGDCLGSDPSQCDDDAYLEMAVSLSKPGGIELDTKGVRRAL